MRFSRSFAFAAVLLAALSFGAAAPSSAQEQSRDTTAAAPKDSAAARTAPPPAPSPFGVRPRLRRDTLTLAAPAPFLPFGRLAPERRPGDLVAEQRVRATAEAVRVQSQALWGQSAAAALTTVSERQGDRQGSAQPSSQPVSTPAEVASGSPGAVTSPAVAPPPAVPADPRQGADATPSADRQSAAERATDLFGDVADLGLQLTSRIETKVDRTRNESCNAAQALSLAFGCQAGFQPQFDFQFNVRTGGVVADRVHVNVDYDSQREFDTSNNINVYYEGKTDELLQRLEVGNVSFAPPSSRFITSGIPSGNYGVQAIGQLGPMRFRTIMAQQKGNVVKDRVFTVGDRTLQNVDSDLDDWRFQPRQFFFTVDPRTLAGYPNVDILNGPRMLQLAAQLPVSRRPSVVYLYRLRRSAPDDNPNGPKFRVRGARESATRGRPYQVLRAGYDYYIDPSNLWFALVRPLSTDERLVVAYQTPDGGEVGTPVFQDFPNRDLVADLIWDNSVTPTDDQSPADSGVGAFWREIRSVYRVGGEDLRRSTLALKVVLGAGGDQEKPIAGTAETYLQMFQLAQTSNSSTFDVDNRLWPRPGDPNVQAGGSGSRLIHDYFLVFPSLRPFAQQSPAGASADSGLVQPGNTANDTLYKTISSVFNTQQRPQVVYRIRARYQSEGGGDAGSLSLGSVQLARSSERLLIDGVQLKRDVDYKVDYDLGQVTFTRPDTLFRQPRRVTVQYEENPLFAAAPTSVFGIASTFPLTNGELNFTVISQSQRTTFNRPPLGFEPASSLVAGVSGTFNFDAAPISRLLERIPTVGTAGPSAITVSGEFATSRPQPNAAGQAYVESFEGEGGLTIALADPAWYYSSQPPELTTTSPLANDLNAALRRTDHAATLSWQTNTFGIVRNPDGTFGTSTLAFSIDRIDPQFESVGQGPPQPETLLWLTLQPLSIGGLYGPDLVPRWRIPDAPRGGRRWRSIRTPLSASGLDVSRVETLEFWTLADTSAAGRALNPTLIFDFGEISENSLTFSPERLCVRCTTLQQQLGVTSDTLYLGKQVAGFDTLNTERDELRQFNVQQNDVGLPGDVAPTLTIENQALGTSKDTTRFALCDAKGAFNLQFVGNPLANCTVRNNRLDEEDLDLDLALNLPDAAKSNEQILRYVVDLSQKESYVRAGKPGVDQPVFDDNGNQVGTRQLTWVYVRIPFRSPTDSLNAPSRRRIRALRLTMLSAPNTDNTVATTALGRLKLSGSPWLKRQDRQLRGISGEEQTQGFTIAGIIGTQDSTSTTPYSSPPGVAEVPENVQTGFETTRTQINERSLRLVTGEGADDAGHGDPLPLYQRAEAYYRFPEGQKNFMGYKELRVWARGNGRGWNSQQLQFYIRIGRDADNFYLYRSPARSGTGQAAWSEVRVDFERLYALRAQLQNAYLQGGRRNNCTGADSALIAARFPKINGQSSGQDSLFYAACADGYMAFTLNPNVSPPNLAAVQELAVGMVRMEQEPVVPSTDAIVPGLAADSLELWVDDIRLTNVYDTPGYAGQLSMSLRAGDVGSFAVNVSRKDPNFRQLAEQASFVTDNALDITSSFRLDRFLPQALGFAVPVTVSYGTAGSDPFFLSNSDVRGAGVQGLRTPKRTNASYSVSLRRTDPLQLPVLATLVNNLSLNGSYQTAETRSEFQTGTANNMTVGADYLLVAASRTKGMPGFLDRAVVALPGWLENTEAMRAVRAARFRWTPTQIRLTSGMARSTDRRLSFTKPAEAASDTGTVARGLSHVWRNTGQVEFRPLGALLARLDLNSLRDLRRYGNDAGVVYQGTNTGVVATLERDRFLGMD
ncbi:MAG TPA: cell surface protein SprA, partial [Gemmatimonadaceae bacterium]|nr:cell surface protein SprA [Gemmatimonadaceae bacterium]